MKNIFLVLVLLLVAANIETKSDTYVTTGSLERPTVNLPVSARQENWLGRGGQGSCVHATMVSLFRWQGRLSMARHWRDTYGDGEGPSDLAAKFDREGVRYAYTDSGDVRFLEWALRTQRGCGVTVKGGIHMVALVYLDATQACILDNNDVQNYHWMPREVFLSEWKNSNGWAVAMIYTPSAPAKR